MQPPSFQVAPEPPVHRKSSDLVSPAAELQRQLTRQRIQLRNRGATTRRPIRWWQAHRTLNHWGSWALVVVLVGSQFACIIWSSQTTDQYLLYGEDPARGPNHIDGYNDEPYSDRSLVCVQQGRLYRPMQLSAALRSPRAEVVDTTGASISGYRVVSRQEIDLHDDVVQRYSITCDMLAATLDRIEAACAELGYMRGSANLHVVDGVFSNATYRITGSLPVLIMPYWDNAIYARYAMPGEDGASCIFHLIGQFDSTTESEAYFRGVNRKVRESKTAEWLRIPPSHRAVWKNGWLEDPTTGQRWYSDISSSVPYANDRFGIAERQFDMLAWQEVDCTSGSSWCFSTVLPEWWGDEFYSMDLQLWYNSIAISNGTRYGLFIYEASHSSVIYSIYDIATLISNTTVATLLFRWLAAIIVLFNAYRRGYSRGFSTPGVGCLACTRSFELLPLLLLPRMTNAFAAFFTAGCKFEGEQRAMSEAWFVIYPAIGEVMLYFYSLLNIVSKVLHRRVSDELFAPTLAFFCLLHWFRVSLAHSDVFGFDGRIASVMTAKEYEKLRLWDFLSTDAALRLNGNVWSIFGVKLGVLALNLVPLVFAKRTLQQQWPWNDTSQITTHSTTIERTIGVRAAESAGLGMSSMYQEPGTTSGDCQRRRLSCYELVRLGYIVFGDVIVISLTDWLLIVGFSIFRSRTRVSNLRVLTFHLLLAAPDDASLRGHSDGVQVDRNATVYQLHDPILLDISVWDIAAVPLP